MVCLIECVIKTPQGKPKLALPPAQAAEVQRIFRDTQLADIGIYSDKQREVCDPGIYRLDRDC